jgi:hypothetical protein
VLVADARLGLDLAPHGPLRSVGGWKPSRARPRTPRLVGHALGAPLVDPTADLIEGTTSDVSRHDRSCLPIQGPPGTGKTYVSSHVILLLLRAGKRVTVTSNSHKAIDNLMIAVAERAREAGSGCARSRWAAPKSRSIRWSHWRPTTRILSLLRPDWSAVPLAVLPTRTR